jgi:hypothetical protein
MFPSISRSLRKPRTEHTDTLDAIGRTVIGEKREALRDEDSDRSRDARRMYNNYNRFLDKLGHRWSDNLFHLEAEKHG